MRPTMDAHTLTDTVEAIRLLAEDAIARGLGRPPTAEELAALRRGVDQIRAVLSLRLAAPVAEPHWH